MKDRLSWYYHDNDKECLEQAKLVASANVIDLEEVERWSAKEGKRHVFDEIKDQHAMQD